MMWGFLFLHLHLVRISTKLVLISTLYDTNELFARPAKPGFFLPSF